MDENKNPEVAETISSNPVPAPQLAETTEAAEETAADAVVTEEVKENTYQETSAAVVPDTKAAVISRLKDIVIAGGEIDRAEVEMLKQTYYKLHNAEIIAARDAFVAAGGNVGDFMPLQNLMRKTSRHSWAAYASCGPKPFKLSKSKSRKDWLRNSIS